MSYDHKDFWMPMDTNREYELLNRLWKKIQIISFKFFKNKKIVITGINGFKGFWLYLLLDNLGAKVSGIGLKSRNYPILNKFTFKKNYLTT